jgi:homoserine kinase
MSANSITVTVPATTANLGCAFDCAGIALSLHLRLTARISESTNPSVIPSEARNPSAGFALSYRGPNAAEIPLDDRNLILKSIRHYAARAGKQLPAANIAIENEIPLGVGLGSSAAAIVGGITLGAALCGAKLDPTMTLLLASDIERHPDNLAAAVFGGMVIALATDTEPGSPADVWVKKTAVSQNLDFVCVIPDVQLSTEKARNVLPAQYSRQDVIANLQRTAWLTACFFSGAGLEPEVFRDRIHQPYRAPLIPGIAQCLEYRAEGLAGVFLSGAGSAVMAIATSNTQHIGEALVAEFRRAGTTARAVLLKADNSGTQINEGHRVPHPLPNS